MNIIYTNDGRVLAHGTITGNETHYIVGDTYFDKISCLAADTTLPEGFSNNDYTFKNATLEKTKAVKVTKYAFRQRFTFEERVKLDNYEDTIDATDLTPEDKENKKRLMKTITNDMDSAIELTLTDPSATAILNTFISCGIISAERMTEVLAV